MPCRSSRIMASMIATFALLTGLLLTTFTVTAQDVATPEAEATPDRVAAHPAHIHSGSCDELGGVVFPLNDVTVGVAAEPPETAGGATPAATPASPMSDDLAVQSTTIVDASLEDILADEHAINVHLSADNIEHYISCGDITGEPTEGELHIDLSELNDSGYNGHAILTDNGDGTTSVTIALTQGEADSLATPEATPGS